MPAIELVLGDITRQQVDVVVNAANSSLLGGGGVDGAIHEAAGPALHAACRALRAGEYVHGLPAGQAVATPAGDLPARWVIHTVGPVFEPGEDRSDVLASCFRESLRLADELGAASVAFPAVSAGRLPLADRRGGQDRRRHRARHPDRRSSTCASCSSRSRRSRRSRPRSRRPRST